MTSGQLIIENGQWRTKHARHNAASSILHCPMSVVLCPLSFNDQDTGWVAVETMSENWPTGEFFSTKRARIWTARGRFSGFCGMTSSAGFAYDNNGNVLTATDAKGTTITNAYDALNRPLTRSYSDGTATVTNTYDDPNIARLRGELTKVTSSVSESRYTEFDAAGRLKQFQQFTDGQTYTSLYEYNLSGALVKETYPSGRVVENEFDDNGDLSRIYGKVTSTATERIYASNFAYSPDGKIERLRLGSGVWESAKFNSRLQVTELAVGWGPLSGSIWKMTTEYGEWNGTSVDAVKNSGNIGKQTVSFSGLANPFVQTFAYDSLQRLTEAKETSSGNQTWREIYDYDRYGNRTTHNKFIGTNEVTQTDETRPEIDNTKNRFKPTEGYTFDANGNIVVDFTGRQFIFNGDNKQTEVKDAQNKLVGKYFYDGEGKRVKKLTYDQYGVEKDVTVFVYSNGKLIAEYTTEAPPQNPTTRFTITDQLGSPRVILDSAGDVVSRRDFLPFGEEVAPDTTYRTDALKYGRTDNVRQKFTGHERDNETSLDFAEARYYNPTHGRFTAVDPSGKSIIPTNPQSWNRYPYCYNNPLMYVDDNGKWPSPKHDRLIENSFRGLSASQLALIKLGSRNTDYFESFKPVSTLWPSEAHKHAMTPDGMTPEGARDAAWSYLNAQMSSIRADQNAYEALGGTGLSPTALVRLGEATHVYEDMTSPVHGFDKEYKIPTTTVLVPVPGTGATVPVTVIDVAKWRQELNEHSAQESGNPTAEQQARTALYSRAFFLIAFGEKEFKRLEMTDEERKAARGLANQYRNRRSE